MRTVPLKEQPLRSVHRTRSHAPETARSVESAAELWARLMVAGQPLGHRWQLERERGIKYTIREARENPWTIVRKSSCGIV